MKLPVRYIYLILFSYVIAAYVFWGLSLHKQSVQIYSYERKALELRVDSTTDPAAFHAEMSRINDKENRRHKQYWFEGATFIAIVLLGAGVVYNSIRKEARLSQLQRNFMLSVTHELKSPIAAIKLNLQTLEKYRLDPDKQAQLIQRCLYETNRLNDLSSNILLSAQFESDQYSLINEPVDLGALVEECARDFVLRGTHHDLDWKVLKPAPIKGDIFLLKMLVSNLWENAVKYSPRETTIKLYLRENRSYYVLGVADEGPGIPAEEKQKVFDKFYRIGNENTRKSKGTGLGLYIVRKIASMHGAMIQIRDEQPQGVAFEVSFRKNDSIIT
jgi:K+-sensing histidine kinase KdpD